MPLKQHTDFMGQSQAGCSPAEQQLNGWNSQADKAMNALFTHRKNQVYIVAGRNRWHLLAELKQVLGTNYMTDGYKLN